MNDNTRFDAIEIKLAHLERAVAEISDVVARQDKAIERLSALNQRLTTQLDSLDESASATAFEKPPHY